MVSQLVVHPSSGPLVGSVPVPGDQDLALARLALGVRCRGTTTLAFPGMQRSLSGFLELCKKLGLFVEHEGDKVRVGGLGLESSPPSDQPFDCRGDAHLGALVLGLLVSSDSEYEVWVDDVVAEALVPALSAVHSIGRQALSGGGARLLLGRRSSSERPDGLHISTDGVFPWVKQAVLLAGLRAKNPTVVEERHASADHLERAMTRVRLPLEATATALVLHPPRDADALAPQTYESLGSPDLALPLGALAASVSGSHVTVREVGTNPTRGDLFTALKLFGARVGLSPRGDRQGEPYGDVSVQAGSLRGASLGGETVVRLGDGILPLLAVAARASGPSVFSDVVPRGNGTDPKIFGRAVGLLRSAGVEARVDGTSYSIQGRGVDLLLPLRVTSGGDSRLVVLATLLALGAKEASVIDDVDCLAKDFPRFAGTLRALGARIEVVQSD